MTSLRSYISSTALITISFITGSNFYTWPRHDDFVTLDKVDSFLAHYWHFECFSWEHTYEFLALFQSCSLTLSNWQWTGHLIWGSCKLSLELGFFLALYVSPISSTYVLEYWKKAGSCFILVGESSEENHLDISFCVSLSVRSFRRKSATWTNTDVRQWYFVVRFPITLAGRLKQDNFTLRASWIIDQCTVVQSRQYCRLTICRLVELDKHWEIQLCFCFPRLCRSSIKNSLQDWCGCNFDKITPLYCYSRFLCWNFLWWWKKKHKKSTMKRHENSK